MSRAISLAQVALDAKARRAVSDLLRHLAHPIRLRQNSFGKPFFSDALSPTRNSIDAQALRRIDAAVRSALDRLSPRQRAIVARCDFSGELHADVIRTLSISAGHFYRERQQALCAIGRYLVAAAKERPIAILVSPDAFTVALAQASTMEQINVYGAIDVLRRLAMEAADAVQQTIANCRLAEACSSAGLSDEAARYTEEAWTIAVSSEDTLDALQLEAAAARAVMLRYAGEEGAMAALSSRMLIPLRAAVSGQSRPSIRESFASVALLVAEHAIERGDRYAAIALCTEALQVLNEDERCRTALRFRAAHWRECARVFITPSPLESISELGRLASSALAAGQLVEAATIATSLASTQRLFDRPDKALQALSPMLDIVRRCCSGESRGGALSELAGSYIRAGQPAQAYPFVDEIRMDPTAGAFVFAYSFLLEAEAALRSGSAQRSLHAANHAIERMTALGRFRFVGSGLRLQALALEASGDTRSASVSIAESVECLRSFGNPRNALRARVDAARLSGDPRRSRSLARKLARGGLNM